MRSNLIYCSNRCYGNSIRKYPKSFGKCASCNKKFQIFTSQIVGGWGIGKFCSRKCYYKFPKSEEFKQKISEAFSGKNHPNWKGGITKGRKERNQKKYRNWRKEIFERDKYTCQTCKARNFKGRRKTVYLEVHHKIPWVINKKLRFEINNGLTLCKNCHYKIKKETMKKICYIKKLKNL